MDTFEPKVSRRTPFTALGGAGIAAALGRFIDITPAGAQEPAMARRVPDFTGPGANAYWSSVGPIASYPQKAPLIVLTDRPVQLETPRQYFLSPFTPNDAFYVRWHLETIPNSVDLKEWRLKIEGNVENQVAWSLSDLLTRFKSVTVAAVNQCSGNSRSRLQPRVAGGQWGNGAMAMLFGQASHSVRFSMPRR